MHPNGLAFPRCGTTRLDFHRRHYVPMFGHRCRDSQRGFNADTGTSLQVTSCRLMTPVLSLRDVPQGVPTTELAPKLDCDRMKLLELRHKLHDNALGGFAPRPLPDTVVEADECYVNAGKKASHIITSG